MDFDWTFQEIKSNLWNGTYTSGTAVTVKNAAYNSTIAVNSSVSFGWRAQWLEHSTYKFCLKW